MWPRSTTPCFDHYCKRWLWLLKSREKKFDLNAPGIKRLNSFFCLSEGIVEWKMPAAWHSTLLYYCHNKKRSVLTGPLHFLSYSSVCLIKLDCFQMIVSCRACVSICVGVPCPQVMSDTGCYRWLLLASQGRSNVVSAHSADWERGRFFLHKITRSLYVAMQRWLSPASTDWSHENKSNTQRASLSAVRININMWIWRSIQ